MEKKRDVRASRTRQAFRDAMLALLKRNDFEQITIQGLCDAANAGRTTFYLHYSDKYALAVDCVESLMQPSQQEGFGSLADFFDYVLARNYEYREVMHRLRRYEGSMELQRRMDAMMRAFFLRYYEEALKKMNTAEREMLAVYDCSGVSGLVLWWQDRGYDIPREEMVRMILRKMGISS